MMWEIGIFIGACAAVSAGCLVPNRWLPPLPNDKLMHAGAFGLLAALALHMAENRAQSMLAILGLLIAGWLIECLQQFLPDRTFCWRDIAANAAGIAVAAAISQLCTFFYQSIL